MSGFELVDVFARGRLTDGRFALPDPEKSKRMLRFGRHVKLVFVA